MFVFFWLFFFDLIAGTSAWPFQLLGIHQNLRQIFTYKALSTGLHPSQPKQRFRSLQSPGEVQRSIPHDPLESPRRSFHESQRKVVKVLCFRNKHFCSWKVSSTRDFFEWPEMHIGFPKLSELCLDRVPTVVWDVLAMNQINGFSSLKQRSFQIKSTFSKEDLKWNPFKKKKKISSKLELLLCRFSKHLQLHSCTAHGFLGPLAEVEPEAARDHRWRALQCPRRHHLTLSR